MSHRRKAEIPRGLEWAHRQASPSRRAIQLARLLEVLENAETDLKKLTRMSPSERQKYFDDGSGFYRHESYLNNVMFCKGTISDIQREEKVASE
ncbi:uncharacterized protein STEHIDRAFT_145060 [Stereum hirsutum FP-91666 SS1]|uniref:uncharacterized protein n=1 Tax=Stereum hirsutum (strain FP-91666) TaxID=721885 RepID=UPI000440E78D|nr:uncharacterized protein STEHIDRAFT_145060 [Stereum hirsutum FP-91666 SS1]EIM89837.1 hypothetical protein STEHIDRAFT_145060 [Stereum hirsutum FP-91666 SS1]